jgi:hypothetical protein
MGGENMSRKRTNEEFLLEIKKINPTYNILSEYINCDTNVICHCNVHNVDFNSTPYNLLKGKVGCELCRREKIGKKNKRTKEDFQNRLFKINPNIDVIGEYVQCKSRIECRCKIHNEIFFATPDHLIRGETGCKQCIQEKYHIGGLKSHEQFINEMKSVNPDIQVIGEYDGAKSRIDVRCAKCGHKWSPTASSLTSGFGCPNCASSRGERRINDFLTNQNIAFIYQKSFSALRGVGGGLLSYDFYLTKYNLLIEYQGEFHDGTARQQTEIDFLRQQEHDRRKKIYAKNHNICLLEIWYWDYDNIEHILHETLNNLENSVEITAL